MKRLRHILKYTALLLTFGACAEWHNALTPVGTPTVWDDTISYSILLPEEPAPQEQFAAKLLQKSIRRITGIEWPIVKQSDGPFVSLGNTAPLAQLEAGATLAPDGYQIRERDGNWYFTGGVRRGPINAVLAFLEEDLGWRNYTVYGGEHYPDWGGRKLEAVPRAYSPPLEIREVHIREAWNPEWVVLNRATPMFGPTAPAVDKNVGGMLHYPDGGWFAHTLARLAPDAALMETHPEYFAEIGGQRAAGNICLSHPETLRIVVANALKVLEANPDANLFGIAQNDGDNVICQCRECKAIAEAEGTNCAPMLRFVNRAAELIHLKYPEVKISTLAYMETYQRPKTIRPGKNVVIFLATDRHMWSHPFHFIDETKAFQEALTQWNETGAEIHIWDYVFGDNQNWMNPAPNFDVLAYNLRFFLKFPSVNGLLFQDNYCSVGDTRGALKNWLLTKLMWNPDWDVRELEKDFSFGYYGAAGEFMQQYNELLREEWQRYHQAVPAESLEWFHVSPEYLPRAEACLTRALNAVKDDAFLSREVMREMLCVRYQQLNRGRQPEEEVEAYLTRVEEFRKQCEALDIRSFAEAQNPETKYSAWKFSQLRSLQSVDHPGSILYWLDDVRLFSVSQASTAKLVSDPLAHGGYAVRQPVTREWSVQWSTGGDFAAGRRYRLRARVRVGKKRKEQGTAFLFGMYPGMNRAVDAQELSESEYRWVDTGAWEEAPAGKVIYTCVPKGAVDSILIDRVEFVPEPASAEVAK